MATLYYKVLKYLEANSKTVSEFDSNIELRNNSTGAGDYIAVWNVDGLVEPNNSQLNALNSTAQTEENNATIKETRKEAYGTWQEQLDMQHHDLVDDTTTWQDHVQAVKDANTKE